MKLRRVLGSFAWVALAAALILVNAAAANAQDKAAEDGQTVQTITVKEGHESGYRVAACGSFFMPSHILFCANNGHFRHEEVCCSRLRSGFFTVYIENATFAMILTKIHMENKKICGRIESELRSNILV